MYTRSSTGSEEFSKYLRHSSRYRVIEIRELILFESKRIYGFSFYGNKTGGISTLSRLIIQQEQNRLQ